MTLTPDPKRPRVWQPQPPSPGGLSWGMCPGATLGAGRPKEHPGPFGLQKEWRGVTEPLLQGKKVSFPKAFEGHTPKPFMRVGQDC